MKVIRAVPFGSKYVCCERCLSVVSVESLPSSVAIVKSPPFSMAICESPLLSLVGVASFLLFCCCRQRSAFCRCCGRQPASDQAEEYRFQVEHSSRRTPTESNAGGRAHVSSPQVRGAHPATMTAGEADHMFLC